MFDHVLDELIEWAEDLATRSIGSRVVVVPAPSGWGRTFLLSRLGNAVDAWPSTLRIRVSGLSCPKGDGPAAEWLWGLTRPDGLTESAENVDSLRTSEGSLQLAAGVPVLTATPALEGPAGLLVAVGLKAEAALRNLLFPNPEARARQAGRRLGARSSDGLVLVEIDDAEMLPTAIIEAFLTGLVERSGGQILAVVVADRSSSDLVGRLEGLSSPSVLARGLRWVAVPDASMDPRARREVMARAAPKWPPKATDRLADKARTFKDIYTVLHHPGAIDVPGCTEPALEVDRLMVSALHGGRPSDAEIVVAWSGGLIHEKQLTAALAVTGTDSGANRLTRTGDMVRITDPARRAEIDGHGPAANVRSDMAQAIAETAAALVGDDRTDLVNKVGLLQPIPVLIDSKDLPLTAPTIELVLALVILLSRTGDLHAARDLATRMTAEAMRAGVSGSSLDRLVAATLALAVVGNAASAVEGLALEAIDPHNEVVFDIEAQLWAAICLLQIPATRHHGLAGGIALLPRLDSGQVGTAALEWRLQFAAAAARAEAHTATLPALAPLFALPDSSDLRQLAPQVVTLPHDRAADYSFAIGLLERDLLATPGHDLERLLRLELALANLYQRIGHWQNALQHQSRALTHIGHLVGPDHPDTLQTRHALVTYVARTGGAREALRWFEDLLSDLIRVLGADNPGTLSARGDIAALTAETGNVRKALQLLDALLADQVRVLGLYHLQTLATRETIAAWTGLAGDPSRALQLYEDLLPDQVRVFGPNHVLTLATRNNIALRTAQIGLGTAARHLYEALLPDAARVLGADHPHTLATRANVAAWTGQAGDPRRAVRSYEDLLVDQVRVLGADHPDTLATRNSMASWTGRAGNAERALHLSQALLPDMVRVLGADHPHTLATRETIAAWTAQTGDPSRALRRYEDLLPTQVRVFGPNHPLTLATRNNIALRTTQIGVSTGARHLYEEILPDTVEVLGADNPHTLTTRGHLAASTGQAGDPRRAVHLYEDLLVDQVRVLGADHPDTLATRNSIASWTGRAGNTERARQLSEALLSDIVRILGADHPHTLAARESIAAWTGQGGDPGRALELYEDLFVDRVRVQGAGHPDTLATRKSIPFWVGRVGNDRRALQLLENLLPDLIRVLGEDHPDTLATRTQIKSLRDGMRPGAARPGGVTTGLT